jgi:uncharacterized protein with gpF-like domain
MSEVKAYSNILYDTERVKRNIWKKTQAKRFAFERKYTMLFKTILNRHFTELADRLDQVNYINENLPDSIIDSGSVKLMMIDLYKNTGLSFAQDSYRQVKVIKAEEDYDDYWLNEMEKYVKTTLGDQITSIAEGSRDIAKKIIKRVTQQSFTEGWGAEVTAAAIKRALLSEGIEMNTWRALRIARTEVMSASNFGAMKGVEVLGMPIQKYWIATYDSRTRDSHLVVEQQNPIDFDSDFEVGGTRMSQPGDPRGGAAEVINCRCSIAFGVKQINF